MRALLACLVVTALTASAPAQTPEAPARAAGDWSMDTFQLLLVNAGAGAIAPPLVFLVPWMQWRALSEQGMSPQRRTVVLAASYATLIPIALISFTAWTGVAMTFVAAQLLPSLERQAPGLSGVSLVLLGMATMAVIGAHVAAVLVLEPLVVMLALRFSKT